MKILPPIPYEQIPEGMTRVEFLAALAKSQRTATNAKRQKKVTMKERRINHTNFIKSKAEELLEKEKESPDPPSS